MDIRGANLFFQLIARRYEKTSTLFTSNKTFSSGMKFLLMLLSPLLSWIVSYHCTIINIKGESYHLKEHKEFTH